MADSNGVRLAQRLALSWLVQRVHNRGFIFIIADHRLTYPSTGFEIIDDVKALLAFLASPEFSEKYRPSGLSLDASRLAISPLWACLGAATGARAAGLYAQPRPRVVFSVFGTGGEFLSDHWLAVKTKHLDFPGSERATDEIVAFLLVHPPAVSSELTLRLLEDFKIADDEGRMNLFFYWWRTGELLDHVVGERGISAQLRALPAAERLAAIPAHLCPAILEANIDASYPTKVLVHGLADTIVLPSESQATYDRLQELGVRSKLITVPHAIHGLGSDTVALEVTPGAEARKRAIEFLAEELSRP